MANIKITDFTTHSIESTELFDNVDSFVRDLSEDERSLQGGFRSKKTLGSIPTLEPGNFCLTLVNGQLVEVFC